ncbi:B3 domain-containing protein Os03g0619800-like isoform X1 [Panicum virgatum]|uniref:TF-B3 domain-containing protein n=1 Tax=Panicum virgatum TaxID=38727 RepID=A0A8T0NDN6_PANVG|nr:B3 domain-containing protein Os03g0619800-like isoform X1 [Panicum virgatum]KAG2547417.1 hypothetical protein PVAP13_9KG099800 [Panicum virgatum]
MCYVACSHVQSSGGSLIKSAFDRGFRFQIYMAGRSCPKNKSCHCYKRCVDHPDGMMKCLLSHANSNRKHGTTIIQIFGSCCCNKDSSCAPTKNGIMVREGSANSIDTSKGSSDHASQSSANETPESLSSSEESEDSPSESQSSQLGHCKTSTKLWIISNKRDLTPEQEEKIDDLVKKIQPQFPVLVVQMKKSSTKRENPAVVISKGYAVEYFPRKTQIITLERPGCKKKWHPRLHIRPNRSGYILYGHWKNFVRDNKLKTNDICIFQPIKGKKFRVIVHLLGEASTHSRSLRPRDSNNGCARKQSSAAHVHENSSSRDKLLQLNHRQHHRVAKDVCASDDSGEPSHPPPFVVLRHTSLTPVQEKAVDEEVKAIQSDVPIFVANMSEEILGDNGTFSLDFASRYAAPHFPDGKQTLTLSQDGWRKAWHIKMLNRRMLPGELREFAVDNRLRTGDLCLFEPMKNERLAMAVRIIRSEQYS